MRTSEISQRYGKAMFDLAKENSLTTQILEDLRSFDEAFTNDPHMQAWLNDRTVSNEERSETIGRVLAQLKVRDEVKSLVSLLADNGRLKLFSEIVEAYHQKIDEENSVCRGQVRSAAPLAPDERKRIESMVEKVINKKVIMNYKVDPELIGGLVAQVGSYTFDDSIESHLRRINEDLKRRAL